MVISSFLFLMLGVSVLLIEAKRRPDLLSIFVFIFSVQVIVPGILIPFILWAIGDDPVLGNAFFDRVYRDVTGEIVALSALLSGLFLFALYVGFSFRHSPLTGKRGAKKKVLDIPLERYFGLLILGLVSSLILLNSMPGDGFFDKYSSLVLFLSLIHI